MLTMSNKQDSYLFFNFSGLMPDDDYFFNDFPADCIKSGCSTVFVDWGSSFPWTIDERLSFFDHLHEKTISAFSRRYSDGSFRIIPVFPFAGGMDFILSFPSYCHLRNKNSCCLLNPEAAGAKSFLDEVTGDYFSLLGSNTNNIAFNMTMISHLEERDKCREAADLLSSFLRKEGKDCRVFLAGCRKDIDALSFISDSIDYDKKDFLFLDYPSAEMALTFGEKTSAVKPVSPAFYLQERDKNLMYDYMADIQSVWQMVRYLKTGIYRIKYSSSISHFDVSGLTGYYHVLVDLFSKIRKTADTMKTLLTGRLNRKSIDRYFDSDIGTIKKEIILIDYDMENINLRLTGG